MDKMRQFNQKKELADHYLNLYGIVTDLTHIEKMSKKELLIKLELKKQIQMELNAAIRLQAYGRMFINHIKYKRLIAARFDSACRI